MHKIAIKIGVLLFLLISTTEFSLFILLHQKIIDTRFEEELAILTTKGNNHRDVLETYYNDETIDHISLMESQSDTNVIVVNQQFDILTTSMPLTNTLTKQLLRQVEVPRKGIVLEDDWLKEPYIITATPFQTEKETGLLFMLQDTKPMRNFVEQLNHHFLFSGLALSIVTALIILIVSNIIAKPLIQMKNATKALSEGNFSIQLRTNKHDELGELAQSIQTLATELSHLKAERNEFLASISHELRTPLTYIKGYADLARNPNIEEENRAYYLSVIIEETNKLTTMVTNLIELAQLESHHFNVKKEPLTVNDALNQVFEKVYPSYQQARQTLTIDCPKGLTIAADPIRFEQLLINLLQNAVRYSDIGAKTKIHVTTTTDTILLSVEDEGKGIPRQVQPYLFERFYRVDQSRSRELGGTGLGLAIVKEIVDAHEWSIKIDSIEHGGTTISIKMLKEQS